MADSCGLEDNIPALKIVEWNANGVSGKRDEFAAFTSQEDIGVVPIGETWLRPSDRFKLVNFRIYRFDRLKQRGGGVAVAIRAHIGHSLAAVPPLRSMEAVAVYVRPPGFSRLKIVSVYAPPRPGYESEDVDDLMAGNDPVLIAGDINSKHPFWGCNITNSSSRRMFTHICANDISVHPPDGPT